MLKKAGIILTVLLLFFSQTAPCFAVNPTISVGSAKAMPGEDATVAVSISGNPGINTFSFGFSYDSTKLTLVSVTPSPALGGQFAYKKRAVWLNSSDLKVNGEILYLRFRVSESASFSETAVSITYSPGDICNYNEDDVNFAVSPGKITSDPINRQ